MFYAWGLLLYKAFDVFGLFLVFVIFVCVINLKMDLLFVSEIYVSHVQCTLMFMNMKNHNEWLYDDARCLTICV